MPPLTNPPRSSAEIQAWLVTHLAQLLKCPPAEIDVTAPFDRLGLDSATAVGATLDLEDWLGRPVEPTAFYEFPSVEKVAEALARGPAASGST
jgi:acyl carrier protein